MPVCSLGEISYGRVEVFPFSGELAQSMIDHPKVKAACRILAPVGGKASTQGLEGNNVRGRPQGVAELGDRCALIWC